MPLVAAVSRTVLHGTLAYGHASRIRNAITRRLVRNRSASHSFRATAWPIGGSTPRSSGKSWTSMSPSRKRPSPRRDPPATAGRSTWSSGRKRCFVRAARLRHLASNCRRTSVTTDEIAATLVRAHLAAARGSLGCAGAGGDRPHPFRRRRPTRPQDDATCVTTHAITILPCSVDRDGKIVGTYDKMHLVMFGEYMPFAEWLPLAESDCLPITVARDAGNGPAALCLDGVCFAPNICYETAIPHVIRRSGRDAVPPRRNVPTCW